MDILSLLRNRYTTKAYDASRSLSPEIIASLAEAVRLSPSSLNTQPWRIKFITDPKLKEQLAECSLFNREKVLDAGCVAVLCVLRSAELFETLHLPTMTDHGQRYYTTHLQPLGAPAVESWHARQVYIALGVLLMAAAAHDVDSTPMEGIDLKGYDSLVGEEHYKPLVAVALGYRDVDDQNQLCYRPKVRRDDSVEII